MTGRDIEIIVKEWRESVTAQLAVIYCEGGEQFRADDISVLGEITRDTYGMDMGGTLRISPPTRRHPTYIDIDGIVAIVIQ